ncbi:hypothetical protein GGI35DRAFT_465442 [Trichoderma velutinum]
MEQRVVFAQGPDIKNSQRGDWNAVDILHIIFNEESYIMLNVAIRSETLSWSDGYIIALQWGKTLESHGISGVYCEILESIVTLRTDPTPISD